jgi:hypothetical protein
MHVESSHRRRPRLRLVGAELEEHSWCQSCGDRGVAVNAEDECERCAEIYVRVDLFKAEALSELLEATLAEALVSMHPDDLRDVAERVIEQRSGTSVPPIADMRERMFAIIDRREAAR